MHESAAFRLEKKSVQEVTVKTQRNFKQIIWQPSSLFYQVEMALGALELIRKMEWSNCALLSEIIIVSFMEMFVAMDAEVGQLAVIQVATVET